MKIILRNLKAKDINERYISWFKDHEVTRFLEASNITIEDSINYLNYGISTKTYYLFAICVGKNNLHIGNVKIGPIKKKYGVSDLVTFIGDKKYWGKSLGSKSILLARDLGFKEAGIRKFSASIDSLNIASINAYTKAGFQIESKINNYFMHNNNNKIIFSNKLFVGCENKNFSQKKLLNWNPLNE